MHYNLQTHNMLLSIENNVFWNLYRVHGRKHRSSTPSIIPKQDCKEMQLSNSGLPNRSVSSIIFHIIWMFLNDSSPTVVVCLSGIGWQVFGKVSRAPVKFDFGGHYLFIWGGGGVNLCGQFSIYCLSRQYEWSIRSS